MIFSTITVRAADRAATVDLLAQRLSDKYVYADEGGKMAAAVRDHLRKGDYDKVATDAEFAELLTAHIQAAHPDKHLSVRHVPNAQPDRPRPSPRQGMPAEMRQRMTEFGKYLNFSFEKVERCRAISCTSSSMASLMRISRRWQRRPP
jgi:hypothetical protein